MKRFENISGKLMDGIEIPNEEHIPIFICDLIESPEFQKSEAQLPCVIGVDIYGKSVVEDIAKMPHLMVAGCPEPVRGMMNLMHSIILSLLYRKGPDEVNLILIDPTDKELSAYDGALHILEPVIRNPKKAKETLMWAVEEIERRYRILAENDVRSIEMYNKLQAESKISKDKEFSEKLPKIVIVVSELKDFMMDDPEVVEILICQITQLGRAAGIHLILATTRPDKKIITGLIKANIPSRAAFKVLSSDDSETILDTIGAQLLQEDGDMLFLPQGYVKPLRIQAAKV